MSLWATSFGGAEPVRTILTGTSATTVLASSTKQAQPIAKVRICNSSGSEVTVDLMVYDGSSTFYLVKDHDLAPGSSFNYFDDILAIGQTLQARCSASNAAHVHVIYALPVR